MNHTRTTAVVLAAPDKTVGAASPGTGTATLEASLPPDGPKKPAPAGNRAVAAKILHANVQHYRDSINTGRNNWGSPKFGPWQQQALLDLTSEDAFRKADKQFTADNEPSSINTWHDDIAVATDAINQWAQKNTIDTTTKPAPATTDVDKALAKADKDAAPQQRRDLEWAKHVRYELYAGERLLYTSPQLQLSSTHRTKDGALVVTGSP